jgi:DNA-binding transcriptional LysR family regulator
MTEQQEEELLRRFLDCTAGAPCDPVIPDVKALWVFDVTVCSQSVAAAALTLRSGEREIVRCLERLETRVGVTLARSWNPSLHLTPEGERLARGIRAGFSQVSSALAGVKRPAELPANEPNSDLRLVGRLNSPRQP